MQAKTTRDLWSGDRPRPSARHTRRSAVRRRDGDDAMMTATQAGTRHPRSRNRATSILLSRIVFCLSIALVLGLGLAFTGRLAVRGEVYPGVHALGVPLGGLTEVEARSRLAARAADLAQTKITLSYEDQTWSPTLTDLGVTFDVDASIHDAMGYGRRDHVVSGLLRPLGVGTGPVDLPLPLHIDQPVFEQTLLELAREIDVAPVDATIAFENGKPVLTPDRDGKVFDPAAAQSELLNQLQSSSTPALTLIAVPESATIRAADFADVQSSLDQALAEPIILTSGDQQWSLSVEDLVNLIRLTPPHDGQAAAIALDPAAVQSVGDRLATEINREAAEPGIDESGDVARLIPAATGRTLRLDDLVAAVGDAFFNGKREVVVPVDESAPSATTEEFLSELGVTDLLATGTSDFAGSDPRRITNIVVATELVDGVMIPPGGSFSFNYSIGEINATPGFVAAGASENGIPGTAVGGGVCQVTTTVFRAALKAGMPITEWWPHAYRNIYYEQGGWAPGFDASVQQPDDDPFNGSDFRFDNPTDNWLLIRSEISDKTKLKVEIYGAPTGYTIQLDDPIWDEFVAPWDYPTQESVDPALPDGTVELVQGEMEGVTMTVYRRVYDADGNEVLSDTFVSTYEPHGPSYRVSEDMAGSTTGGQ